MNPATKRKRLFLITLTVACLFAAWMLRTGSLESKVETRLSTGARVQIINASLWDSCRSRSSCRIVYYPKGEAAGTIVLLQDSLDQIAMVMPASDGKSLLCLYDADVVLHLMKFNPAYPPEDFPNKSYLNSIVMTSPWLVKPGTSNDWQEVSDYLNEASPSNFAQQAGTKLDLVFFRFRYEKEELMPIVERQRTNMLSGCEY